jgi:hypothetical protein
MLEGGLIADPRGMRRVVVLTAAAKVLPDLFATITSSGENRLGVP